MIEYETRTLKTIVLPKGKEIFCEEATTVEIKDEAAGEFVEVNQDYEGAGVGTIRFEETDWHAVSAEISRMISMCRANSPASKKVDERTKEIK
jgi:hypothetical protein